MRLDQPALTAAAELATLWSTAVDPITIVELTHNAFNPVTAAIWRVGTPAGRSAVLKLISRRGQSVSSGWKVSDVPSSWNYWRREALIHQSGLPSTIDPSQSLRAPRLIGAVERRPDGDVALWFEGVEGTPVTSTTLEHHRRVAIAVGRAQGSVSRGGLTSEPWLSRNFLREYVGSRVVSYELLDDSRAWAHPLIRRNWPPTLRNGLLRLHAQRHRLLELMERLPRTLCHLDLWPANEILAADGSVVLLDWSFTGDGALGEDIGNHILDSFFDMFLPADALGVLDAAMTDGYLEGLLAGGWNGDPKLVRLGICASAVKYDWLGPRMLERTGATTQYTYGGTVVDPDDVYRARGITLGHVVSWADEALALDAALTRRAH